MFFEQIVFSNNADIPTPSAGYVSVFQMDDGFWYQKDENGGVKEFNLQYENTGIVSGLRTNRYRGRYHL